MAEEQTGTGEDGGQDSDPYEGMDRDTLIAELKESKTAAETAETNRRDHQSASDKQFREMEKSQARLEGQVQAMNTGRKTDSSLDQADFDKDWEAQIREDPTKAMGFYRGLAEEQDEKFQKRLDAQEASFNERLQRVAPGYAENEEEVKAVMEQFGIKDVGQATKIALAMKEGQATSHAAASPPPGRTTDTSRASASSATPRVIEITPEMATAFAAAKMAGCTEEDMKKIRNDTAADLEGEG